jgi:hypothetical protein
MVRHEIQNQQRAKILKNRVEYAGFFILAVIEMLKYAVKEDYENSKSEIKLLPVTMEYIRLSNKAKLEQQKANFKNIQKKIYQKKKKKGKLG